MAAARAWQGRAIVAAPRRRRRRGDAAAVNDAFWRSLSMRSHSTRARRSRFCAPAVDGRCCGSGLFAGSDVTFWSRALRYAALLVAAQRYVPALDASAPDGATTYRATWRPRVARRSERNSARSRPRCRRPAGRSRVTIAPLRASRPPRSRVRFVDRAVDALVRSAAVHAGGDARRRFTIAGCARSAARTRRCRRTGSIRAPSRRRWRNGRVRRRATTTPSTACACGWRSRRPGFLVRPLPAPGARGPESARQHRERLEERAAAARVSRRDRKVRAPVTEHRRDAARSKARLDSRSTTPARMRSSPPTRRCSSPKASACYCRRGGRQRERARD